MQLDKLEIDLRPRPNAQALDLGFALIRAHAKDVYLAWWALWLPLMLFCGLLAWLFPEHGGSWSILAWWLKPLLERTTLYILSRQVFGEEVSWCDALRAWPKQLGGGMFRLLTWWRPFMPGRALYQPIWQLEGARGKAAAERRKVIGRNNTGRSAYWFGIACAHFVGVIEFGFFAFIGIFLSSGSVVNPFAGVADAFNSPLVVAITFVGYALADGIIGPIYTACGFTLYLNRRATLEAWDIEIMLRQIKPPALKKNHAGAVAALFIGGIVSATLFLSALPSPSHAAEMNATKCEKPAWLAARETKRTVDQSPQQTQLRDEVARLFESKDLRDYECTESWRLKKFSPSQPADNLQLPHLQLLAQIIKILLIAGGIGLVCWLLYRYRDKFPAFPGWRKPAIATEIGGLDIRAESLPDDVVARVLQLWTSGERRAALALLYRATLSHLMNDDHLPLTKGATEGDCLRLAKVAHRERRLNADRLQIITGTTGFWLNGAYGNRWPDTDAVTASCHAWQMQFGKPVTQGQS